MRQEIKYTALANRVIAVAVINYRIDPLHFNELFDWAAYIDAVPGQNHDNEMMQVARLGEKIDPKIAKILFSHLDIEKYRR